VLGGFGWSGDQVVLQTATRQPFPPLRLVTQRQRDGDEQGRPDWHGNDPLHGSCDAERRHCHAGRRGKLHLPPDGNREPLVHAGEVVREGLLALSVGLGLGVVHELMALEVDEVVSPKGKHNRGSDREPSRARARVDDARRSAGGGPPASDPLC
jgi:hypothetical protein